MYDAVTPAAIPSSAPTPDYVLGYVNGRWPSYDALVAKYPTAVPVAISVISGDSAERLAQGCDQETGDYTPAQAAHFAATKLVLGVVPFIYCSLEGVPGVSGWHSCQLACTEIGVDPNEVDWGIAAYPGIGPVPYPGSAFHQWVDWGNYDQSAVVDGWVPGRLIHPPSPPQEEIMVPQATPAVSFKQGQTDVFQVNYGVVWHKWLKAEGWGNEQLSGPFSVNPTTKGVKFPDQNCQVSILGTQCIVTAVDEAGRIWLFVQYASQDTWGVAQAP